MFEKDNVFNNDAAENNEEIDVAENGNETDSQGETIYSDAEFDNPEENSTDETVEVPYHELKSEPAEESPKKKKNKHFMRVVALAVVFGIVAGSVTAITNVGVSKIANSRIKIASTQNVLTKSDASAATSDIADIVEECMPSVVSITNKSVTEIMTFFGKYAQENVSSGSGIIVGKNDSELLVVTNYHVIADSKELSVVFSDTRTAPTENGETSVQEDESGVTKDSSAKDVLTAQVKGYDSDKDLAVVSIKLSDISADLMSKIKIATIGDSSVLRPGERVIAIGNALGYGKSVTTGIVSATNRDVTLESQTTAGKTVTNKFIQTDAAINGGNSGGALLNMNGEVIGINSVKIVSSGVEGMGYAIPISDVQSIIDNLMLRETRETVDEDKQGFLGITFADVDSTTAEAFGMPAGVLVKSVTQGSAAEKAGIKKGFIITKFDGYSVNSGAELQNRLTYYKAGETKKITVQVAGENGYEERELTVTLDSRKKSVEKMQKDASQQNGGAQQNDGQ